jgi:hypothetical protein
MARIDIKRFKENKIKNSKLHNLVEGEYSIVHVNDNLKLLQIDTFGSDDRQIGGKVSQSIQLDYDVLELLVKIFQEKFRVK